MASQHVGLPSRLIVVLWMGSALFFLVCGAILVLQGLLYLFMDRYSEPLLANVELLGVATQRGYYPDHHAVAPLWLATHPLHSSLSVTHPNYGVVRVLSELVQTVIQTKQAYELSARVAKTWMNHTIVLLIVVNCWAAPLVRHSLGRLRRSSSSFKTSVQTTTQSLGVVVINLVLDFTASFAFPIALFVPYARDYNVSLGVFRKRFWYTDVWIMQLVNEWPLVFVTSPWDAISKILVAYNIARALQSIPKLLRHHHQRHETHINVSSSTRAPSAVQSLVSVAPAPPASPPYSSNSYDPKPGLRSYHLPRAPILRSRIERWGHRLLGLWGLVVLVLHLQSSSTPHNPQCLLQVRPWLVRRPVCSLMEICCNVDDDDHHDHHDDGNSDAPFIRTGNGSDFDTTIDSIDSTWLAYLVIRHCPQVEITPRVQQLSWLMALKIYNSTLVQWDTDAALTQQHHPHMLFVFIVASNVSSFPRGLYHRDFPAKLLDVEFSSVNLTTVPHEIAHVWPRGMFLVLEGLQLAAFPEALVALQPAFLAITNNGFTDIPVALYAENPALRLLNLNGNPVRELPRAKATTPRVATMSLYMMATQIAQVPSWLDGTSETVELFAGSTPLCDALASGYGHGNGNGSGSGDGSATRSSASTSAMWATWHHRVNCVPAHKMRYLSHYPLLDEAINNPSKPH